VEKMNRTKNAEFYEQQIELEQEIIKAAEASVKRVKNILVKELILGISQDSKKHKSILKGISALREKNTEGIRLISEEEREELKQSIETHIELEQKAIDTYRHLLGQIIDVREKMLLKTILKDELRHHALLKWLYDVIIKDLTLTEDDIFDMTWKDVIWQDGT
jgi:rubrerythrin